MPLARYPVLFVMAPGGFARRFPEHLGTAFLRTVLRRAGIGSRQYLPRRNPSLSGFADFLRESQPQVVGFTFYESNLSISRALIRATRETLPDSVILVGGPNATFTPEDTLDLLNADVCLRGAGEGTIASLVGQILGSESASTRLPELLRDIPNLVLRAPNGPYFTPSGDLSSFPAAHFSTLDDIPSPFQNEVVSTPDIGYLTARGCNQHCTYCSFAAVSGRKVAFHSVERVLDDLEALEKLATRTPPRNAVIQIYDDAFSQVPERARRICEGIIKRHIRLALGCETRGDRVTPDLLRLMRQAGFVSISFGLESAVPRVLRAIGKVRSPDSAGDSHFEAEREYLERIQGAVKSARRCGFEVKVSVIGGLPGETAKDFRTTLKFVSSLKVDLYAHNVLILFPGTPLHDRRHSFGLNVFREPQTASWRTVHSYPVSEVRSLSNSTDRQRKWNAAQILADALCGRPGGMEAAEPSVWAVVLHGHPRTPELAAWLRRVLAISGSVVAFVDLRSDAAEWNTFLRSSRVPFGTLSCLVPDGSAQTMSFDVLGSVGGQRVRFVSACSSDAARVPVGTDKDWNCEISIWLTSAPDAQIPGRTRRKYPLIGPGLQVADSCRLGNASPRCQRPRVLHVDSTGKVRACWYGPVIGTVGDGMTKIVPNDGSMTALGESFGDSCKEPLRCPLGLAGGMDDDIRSQLWELDLASQLCWSFPRAARC
jgi:radical SAM superfamily enzyme YgiQ (UPF0313 family)